MNIDSQLFYLVVTVSSIISLIAIYKLSVYLYIKMKFGTKDAYLSNKLDKLIKKSKPLGKVRDIQFIDGKRFLIKTPSGIVHVKGKFSVLYSGEEAFLCGDYAYLAIGNICKKYRIVNY